MTPSTFAAEIQCSRRVGEGRWMGKCPAHDDRQASLSIGTGDDGRVLVNCHAGCTTGDICGALGVAVSDLFVEELKARDPVAVYEYRDKSGSPLARKIRYWPKRFTWQHWDGSSWQTGRPPHVAKSLYGLERLPAPGSDAVVLFVEGERDVDSAARIGLIAVCNPDGASEHGARWADSFSEALSGLQVAVVPDNDEPGHLHAKAVLGHLRASARSVRILELPVGDKGDLSDWIGAGGTREQLLAMLDDDRDFRSAKERIAGERQERKDTKLVEFDVPFLDDICRGITSQDVILLGGSTGTGKTALAASIAEAAARKGRRVFFFALEAADKEIERRIKYRFISSKVPPPGQYRLSYVDWVFGLQDDIAGPYEDAAQAEVESLENLHTFYRVASEFTTDDLLDKLRSVADEADLVVIDHLHYIDTDSDTSENRAMAKVVKCIRDAALNMKVPMLVLAHLRKKERGKKLIVPEVEDFMGTGAITQIATRVVVLAPAFDQPPEPSDTEPDKSKRDPFRSSSVAKTYMWVGKDRHAGATRFVALMNFNIRKSKYEPTYRLGRMSYAGDRWDEVASEHLPPWATREVRGLRK